MLVLSHSIGTDHGMWAPQMPDLLQHFQVLRYDTRGHGASDAPEGEYTIDQLGRDVLGLVDILKIAKFSFCGLSMGGAIGQWLALNSPDRLNALVLANTSPQFGPPANWVTRRKTVLENGMAAIVDLAMQRFFSPEVLRKGHPCKRRDFSPVRHEPDWLRRLLFCAARCRPPGSVAAHQSSYTGDRGQ